MSNQFFLQTAVNAVREYRQQEPLDRFDFQDFIEDKINLLEMPQDLLTRSVNVGFSGGEKNVMIFCKWLLLSQNSAS